MRLGAGRGKKLKNRAPSRMMPMPTEVKDLSRGGAHARDRGILFVTLKESSSEKTRNWLMKTAGCVLEKPGQREKLNHRRSVNPSRAHKVPEPSKHKNKGSGDRRLRVTSKGPEGETRGDLGTSQHVDAWEGTDGHRIN